MNMYMLDFSGNRVRIFPYGDTENRFYYYIKMANFPVFVFFQRDKVVQQRQFATLDLFLESARQQLKLLMDNNTEEQVEKENS